MLHDTLRPPAFLLVGHVEPEPTPGWLGVDQDVLPEVEPTGSLGRLLAAVREWWRALG